MIANITEDEPPQMAYTIERDASHPNDKHFFQYLVAITANLLMMTCGYMIGWSSPAIPKLLQPDSPVSITLEQGSWIIALIEAGFFITAIPSALLLERLGRKTLLIIGVVPITAAWILVGTVNSVVALYIGRLMMGVVYGLYIFVLPVYLAEISSPKIRGRLTLLMMAMTQIGIFIAFVVGPFVSFVGLAFVGLIPLAPFCVFCIWMPESPYYLLSKDRAGEALTSLTKLRGHTDVKDELQAISVAVVAAQKNKGTFRELFYNYGNRRALITVIGLSVGYSLSGGVTIVVYAETIFQKICDDSDVGVVSIVFGCVQLVVAIGTASVIDHLGRRLMMMISVIGTSACSFVLGLYFFLDLDMPEVMAHYTWFPIMAMMLFIAFYLLGLGTIIYCMIGELFPPNLRAVGGFAHTKLGSVLIFGMHKLFQTVSEHLGSHVPFWSISLFLVFYFPFVYFWVPETKGKRLETIITELNSSTKKNENSTYSLLYNRKVQRKNDKTQSLMP